MKLIYLKQKFIKMEFDLICQSVIKIWDFPVEANELDFKNLLLVLGMIRQ